MDLPPCCWCSSQPGEGGVGDALLTRHYTERPEWYPLVGGCLCGLGGWMCGCGGGGGGMCICGCVQAGVSNGH